MSEKSETKFSAKAETTISAQHVANLMITAFEGGSNYWIESLSIVKVALKPKGDTKNYPWYAYANVYEDPELEFRVSLKNKEPAVFKHESIQKGFNLLYEKYPQCIAEILDGSFDAETADTFLQNCLFGDIIYDAEAWEGPSKNPLALIYDIAIQQGLARDLEDKLCGIFSWSDFDEKNFLDDLLAEIAGGVNIVAREDENGWYAMYEGTDWSRDKYFAQQRVQRSDGVVFVVEATPGDGVVMTSNISHDRAYIVKHAHPRFPDQARARLVIHKSIMESNGFTLQRTPLMHRACD
jgi:hypothetical protein